MTTAATGTQATTIVNSGSAIDLKSVTVSFQAKANVDASEIINTNTGPIVGFGTVTAGKITIRGVLNTLSSGDMLNVVLLNDLRSSFGIKLLFYTSIVDGYRDLTDTLGIVNEDDVHKTNDFGGIAVPHLHIRVTSFDVTHPVNNIMRFILEGLVTT